MNEELQSKLNVIRELVQALRNIEDAKRDIDMIFEGSTVRLTTDDTLQIDNLLESIHAKYKEIKVVNNKFIDINLAFQKHE